MRRRIAALVAVVTALGSLLTAGTVGSGAGAASGATPAATHHIGGRQSRTSGIGVGGGDYFLHSMHRSSRSGDVCTLAFAVRSNRPPHRLGILTAGHCAKTLRGRPPFVVHQTQRGRHDTTYPGVLLGEIDRGRLRFGKYGDSAFVRLAPHRSAEPRVFVGGVRTTRTIRVAGKARPHNGMHVCYSGAASGEHCGFRLEYGARRVGFPVHHRARHVRHEWTANRPHCPARPGDSGAPVYVKRHGRAFAVGILTGGRKQTGQCPFYFSPVRLALRQLHVHLVTKH